MLFRSVNYIIEQDADIVCLQESNNDHDARRTKINKQLDKHYPYLAKKWATKNGVSELRCYSKFPIIASEVIEVESFGNGAMACEIVINEDTILVVNNHLESNKLTREDRHRFEEMTESIGKSDIKWGLKTLLKKMGAAASMRTEQIQKIKEYTDNNKNKSVIICGDFNDSPISYALTQMSDKFNNAFVRAGNGLGFTFYQHGIHLRIDHILHSNDWKAYNSMIDNTIKESDHYPIFTHLKKQKK